jgi:chemotaxis protein methyltransferase CheR
MNGAPIDVKILATDISTSVLKTAESGIYQAEKTKNIPPSLVRKYFQGGAGKWEGYYRVKKDIRDIVQFKRFNLMEPPPRGVYFDVIFCRNVMIYFDKQTQSTLVNRLYESLVAGGYLFIGHSESLTGLNHRLKYIEPSVYRK